MKRSSVNFVIDLISLIDLLGLTFTGAIMKWVLPPGTGGEGRQLHGGRGRGGEHIEKFLSLGRHDWGSVHFWLAVVFLALMVVHIVLHWTWIKSYIKCRLLGRAN
jgi:hypothetical protein